MSLVKTHAALAHRGVWMNLDVGIKQTELASGH